MEVQSQILSAEPDGNFIDLIELVITDSLWGSSQQLGLQ